MRRREPGRGSARGGRARRGSWAAGGALLLALLTGCGTSGAAASAVGPQDGDGLHGTDVTDVIHRPALALTDTDGRSFDLQDRARGELTVVYFGYTRCPDLCPTAMADLAAARRQLSGADRSHVEVVFVTEDPANDSAPVVRRWLDAFDPSFIGLTGGDPEAEASLDALKAPRTVILPSAPPGVAAPKTGTTVQHTNSVYAFRGDKVVVYTDRTSPSEYAADFHDLLRG